MITLKTPKEIEIMRRSGVIASGARKLAGQMLEAGIATRAIDREVRAYMKANGALPSFLHYRGFPASVCVSVNDEVIHGIPGKRILREGDIVDIDVGAQLEGYHSDCCATFPVGVISDDAKRLIKICRESFFKALDFARKDCRIADVSRAVQMYVEENGFSIVRDYCGHGVGRSIHEDPEVPNYVEQGARGVRLVPGMVLAIEPMVNLGDAQTYVGVDEWTVHTKDGSISAHYENTVLITNGDPEILTPIEGDGFV
ncbi:MAG: type I methionyl aminopeptidase [Oscillospiraceae bacterium]|jgi:methionyl aminopeptidase|nr:type I methionyl aminopeptidase [Oscillospiraceae bacterium]